MYAHIAERRSALLPTLVLSGQTLLIETGQRFRRTWQRAGQALRHDWQNTRAFSYGLILLLIVAAFTSAYYLNHPQPEVYPDTPGYFSVTQRILARGNFVDALRTPGYPTFIALVFLVAGQANLAAVSVAQGVLFVLATLEIYALAVLLFRHCWIALGVGVLMGCNTYLLSFVKPLMSEGLGLWLVTSLALVVVLFLQRWQTRYLWLVTLFALLLFMTRPEWIYLPVLLFAYLLLIAWRRGTLRRFLPHGLATLALLYAVLGLYVYENGVQNGFAGVTYNQRGNLLGKILQYHMQNEASPQYANAAAIVNAYVAQGGNNPDTLVRLYPPLAANHWELSGEYSQDIVAHHPLEFLLDTIPVFFTSSNRYYSPSPVSAHGRFGSPLLWFQTYSAHIEQSYPLFPLFALFWIVLFCWRRTTRLPVVEGMGVVVLLTLYGLALTSLGGYTDFIRLHTPFAPLFQLTVIGTLLASLPLLLSSVVRGRWQWKTAWLALGGLLLGAIAVSIARLLLTGNLQGVLQPQTWLAVHFVIHHAALALIVLAAGGIMIWLAYRAHLAYMKSEQANHHTKQMSSPDAAETGFLEEKAQEAQASRP